MKTKFFTILVLAAVAICASTTTSKAQGLSNGGALTSGKFSLDIGPNPTSIGFFKIESVIPNSNGQQMSSPATFTVLNMSGQTMYTEQCTDCGGKTARTVSTSGFPAGVYIVRLQYLQRILSKKLVVQ